MPNRMTLDEALNMVRSAGRFGDTELAHINPREAAVLRAMGGSGSINPATGLREYAFDPGTGLKTDPGGPEGAIGAGMGAAPETTTPQGSGQTGGEQFGEFFGLNDPKTAGPVIANMFGPVPGMGVLAMGVQELGNYLRDKGYSVDTSPLAYSPGPEGRNEALTQAMAATPAAPNYLRGSSTSVPSEISQFMGPGMSDLQQRALIGTYGTQGMNPAFRTDPVRRYYANVLSRELVQPGGQLAQTPSILPIEQQYLSGVIGRPVQDYSNAAQVYEAIRGLM